MDDGFDYSMRKGFLADKLFTYGCSGVELNDFPETVRGVRQYNDAVFRLLQHRDVQTCGEALHVLRLLCEDQIKYGKCDFASTMRALFEDVPNDREQIELSLNKMFPFEKPIEKPIDN